MQHTSASSPGRPESVAVLRLSSSELVPPPLQHSSAVIRWARCLPQASRVVQALQSLCRGGHRLPGWFWVWFRLVNSCVLSFVLTQLAWPPARRQPAGTASIACASAAGCSSPAQPGGYSGARQTWRAPELGELRAVPLKMCFCDERLGLVLPGVLESSLGVSCTSAPWGTAWEQP